MRILPTKRWKTFLLAGESYLAGAMVHWCRIIFESLQKKWDGQQHIQLSILTDYTLRFTCLCNCWKLITFYRFGRPEEMGGIVSFLVSDEVWFCFPIEYWYYLDSISKSISNQYQKFSLVSGLLLDWGEHRSCRGDEREAVILLKMLLKMVLNINLYIVATIINISLYIVGTITEWKVEGKEGRMGELWKQCGAWLVRLNVLPANHRLLHLSS